LNLLDLTAVDVYEVVEAHRQGLKNPSKTVAEYLSTLESEGLVRMCKAAAGNFMNYF
jgi:hypothetical protein